MNVLLLREPSLDTQDRYETAFKEAGYCAKSVPVLETVHDNVDGLQSIIWNGPAHLGIGGVVITSKRSCDTWREGLRTIRQNKDLKAWSAAGLESWCTIPFYVVGPATASALSDVFTEFKDLGLNSVDIRGDSCGNAASLAPFILEDMKSVPRKLLYLTGDKNRDTLPRILNDGGIELETLQVYTTRGSPSFQENLARTLHSMSQGVKHWWIVYFAPSTAAFVTPTLQNHFTFAKDTGKEMTRSDTNSPENTLPIAKVAAIGPTTDTYLRGELHLLVDVMAQKPTPEDVVKEITRYDHSK
ncbi:hypothetical protein D9613_003655 [Agrocybe pediades]|uniref:Tetrapyrrole biosynthesis uroporphyrinogen III synthase domain-containing protein n=1 Tax=Agrocybe pediades TaxID=84607 RepID=A0A8H4QJG6_9AGAR|nr:hypothetical protein D9613_003655 [Agrocybe pediades]